MPHLIPQEVIEQKIFLMRGHKVMLSPHLAELYGVETRALNQAVKRNQKRFPHDFMFRINKKESDWLVSQNVIPHKKYFGGSMAYAFTEHKRERSDREHQPERNEQGVAMLSGVLSSDRAITINIQIMRAFVKLRQIISTHKDLAGKLSEMERKLEGHDTQIKAIFMAIKQLMTEDEKPKARIGFHKQ